MDKDKDNDNDNNLGLTCSISLSKAELDIISDGLDSLLSCLRFSARILRRLNSSDTAISIAHGALMDKFLLVNDLKVRFDTARCKFDKIEKDVKNVKEILENEK